jgi:hypothetical protein
MGKDAFDSTARLLAQLQVGFRETLKATGLAEYRAKIEHEPDGRIAFASLQGALHSLDAAHSVVFRTLDPEDQAIQHSAWITVHHESSRWLKDLLPDANDLPEVWDE